MSLSYEIKEKIEKRRGHFPTEEALLIPLLHEIQNERGWISEDSMREAAEYLHLTLKKVKETATFYTMFNKKPIGKYHIQVCGNVSCCLRGAHDLMHTIEEELQIKPGQTTKDNKFTLSEVECLAACGTAPAMMVNEEYFEEMGREKLKKLLSEYKNG